MEVLTGPFIGVAVGKLLNVVLDALKDLKDRDDNLHKLELLLQRLKPFVRDLQDFAQNESIYPVRRWLEHLQEQLEKAREVIQDHSKIRTKIIFPVRSSRICVKLYDDILKLLSEATVAEWAVQLSSTRRLREDLEHAHNDRAEMKAKLETLEQQILVISEAVTSEPSRFRTRETKRVVSEPIVAIRTQNNSLSPSAPSSSASSSLASSSSNSWMEKQHWNRDSDISEPTVCFGGDAVAQQLISNLVDPERYRKWVGLWAMGGAGKTFTAKKVYNDNRIREHFTGGRYWVTVSKDQPPVYMLLKDLFVYIDGIGKFPNSLEDAKALLKSWLNKDKVLLILDDVWDRRTLEHLDLVSGGRKGVILVTTRDEKILTNAMDCNDIVEIPRLSEEDSWKLFTHHAFFAHKKDIPSDLEKVARDVADECKGLPLALQVIGSSMGGIRLSDWEVRQLGKSRRQEWEDALEKLRRANVGKDEYDILYRRLQISVDNLSEEHPRLQECFFYFAAFPEDFQINMEWLVTIWIAEGIVGNEHKNLALSKTEGRALVGLLVSKSMIELIDVENRNVCKIHDVMRDLAHRNLKWKANRKHELVKIQPSERTCLYAPGLKAEKFPEEWTTSGTACSVERLSLHSNDLEQMPDQFEARSLRVLILKGNERLRALPLKFLMSLSQLTVLDLSETCVEKISGAILRSLRSLVLLKLEGCAALREISDRIGDLQNLQFIILDGCEGLQKLPQMKRVTKLHTLSLHGIVEYTRSSILLRRPAYNIRQVLQLRHLKRLCIGPRMFRPSLDISPLVTLEELEMEGVKSLPRGMSKLGNLRILHVFDLDGSLKPGLEKLPLLEDLMIVCGGERSGLALPTSFGHSGAFPSLKKMSIWGLQMMEVFTFRDGAMPKIQSLKVTMRSRDVPPSLTVLGRSLNFLRIKGECKVENLELVFSDPSKFSNLEYLELGNVGILPSTIASLPRLRWLRCDIERWIWPQNLVQLEKQGKLKIDVEKTGW